MLKYLILLLFIPLSITVWADSRYFDPEDSLQIIPPDTIPPNNNLLEDLAEEAEFSDEEDSTEAESYAEVWDDDMCALIHCDLYESVWDTVRINPYGVDMKKRVDSTTLRLIHDSECDYAHPVCGMVTSEFGFRRSRYHYGIDIDLETGDEVFAAFEGTVRVARYSPSYGYYVIIRHLNGLETLYAHLSNIQVTSGMYLQAGDVLGLGGNTGRSRGSHLHFEVRFLGQQINPRDLISFENYTCSSDTLCVSPASFAYLKGVEKHKAKLAAARYYKIKKGDTLGRIAKKHRTTVSRLCKLNKMSSRTILRPGRRIRVA